ncbi:MAG: hypothetical protein JSS09_05985 [Verrucomicrobia bacterium]|nr:hypothetical protein [Verrucomicrobiota bacterium]
MNISSRLNPINFPPRDKYLQPCCYWPSSTKARMSVVLTQNLEKIDRLKKNMYKSDDLPPIRISWILRSLYKPRLPSISEMSDIESSLERLDYLIESSVPILQKSVAIPSESLKYESTASIKPKKPKTIPIHLRRIIIKKKPKP